MIKEKRETSLKDLQNAELDILNEFIRVCNELKIKYFLDSGTLIGCIRHQGFIPWDDDIDVSMPREDYEILLENGQKILKNKYFLQTYKTEKNYTLGFAKLRNSETTFIETSVKNLDINHGIYIDIFPLDGYKPQEIIKNFINEKKRTLHCIQINKKYVMQYKKESFKEYVLKIISNILYGRKSVKQLLEQEEREAKKNKYKQSDYVCSGFDPIFSARQIFVSKEVFENGKMKKFEGIDVRVPQNYDAYLKRVYGNYMQLPPVEDRVTHHYNEIIDINKSYKEYR